jgi:hypothetical protein
MRWQYRITFAEGNTGTCIREDRVWDPLFFYREKFGADRVLRVEERWGNEEFISSELLPTSQEEADGIE